MSMPQSGAPDPNTPGPLSGGTGQQFAAQGPPHQQPFPGFTTPGQSTPSRPAPLVMGAVAVGVIGLLFLISAIVSMLGMEYWIGDFSATGNSSGLYINGAYNILLALAAMAAAGLSLAGIDLGRALALGVAGAAVWEAAGWWKFLLTLLFDGDFSYEYFAWVRGICAIIAGFLGIAAIIMLGIPSISSYLASQRGKASAGVPPAGPQPGFAPQGQAQHGPVTPGPGAGPQG